MNEMDRTATKRSATTIGTTQEEEVTLDLLALMAAVMAAQRVLSMEQDMNLEFKKTAVNVNNSLSVGS